MTTEFDAALQRVRAGEQTPDEAAGGLLAQLTVQERLGLLDGDQEFWPAMVDLVEVGYNREPYVAGAVDRLGIPGVRFVDGPRGAVVGSATCFPVSMARGASWDVELEEEIGTAIGREVRALGGTFFGGVCVNLLRHPAWGRAQETYGEDPVLLGELGAALTRGAQRNVMACVKHFACNSIENTRFVVDVRVAEAGLHELYLPHFRRVVDEGVASVMSAYNALNGEWCGQHGQLLTDILRDEWGFAGFVVSDFFFGLRDAAVSLNAGLDVEMPFRQQRAEHLPAALEDGRVSMEVVDTSARRILATQLRSAATVESEAPGPQVVACDEHRALARRAASRGMVLLENRDVDGRPLLPAEASTLRRVAVVGRFADVANLGDHGSSAVRPPHVVTPLAGLRAALPDAEVVGDDGADHQRAAELAADADLTVVMVGNDASQEGEYIAGTPEDLGALLPPGDDELVERVLVGLEASFTEAGGDRSSLRLREDEVGLIRAVGRACPRTVVAVMAGSAVLVDDWRDEVAAVLSTWYAGMEGGHALADVLLGVVEPGGRLPFAVPRDEAHLPPFDPAAGTADYDAWVGQRRLDRDGHEPDYPLGFGLGYTTFELAELSVEVAEGGLRAEVDVANVGGRAGGQVIQLYAVATDPGAEDAVPVLVGFTRVDLEAGLERRVSVPVSLRPLQRRHEDRTWEPTAGSFELRAAAHAGDPRAATATVELTGLAPSVRPRG